MIAVIKKASYLLAFQLRFLVTLHQIRMRARYRMLHGLHYFEHHQYR